MRILHNSILGAAVLAVAISGCAEKKVCNTAKAPVMKKVTVDNRDTEIQNLQAELAQARTKSAKVVTVTKTVAGSNSPYPPNAEPGKCYKKVLIPAKYTTQTEKVLKSQGGEALGADGQGERISIIPATYKNVTEKVLVREAGEKLVTIPATYKNVTEKILVKEASERLVKVPATYGTQSEKMLVKEASTDWKKSNCRGGDCGTMCLVETPAQYRTVTRKVLKNPATVKSIPVPAAYKTVTRKVVDRPASTKSIPVPAVYKTVTRKVVDRPASTRRTPVPPTYQTVTRKIKVQDSALKWVETKCRSAR